MENAVALCLDVATDGWQETVADRAAACITPQTWNHLFRGRRRGDCRVLADLARAILRGKQQLHEIIGAVAAWLTRQFGGEALERTVARELAQRIPIPVVDEKAIVVARGLQMIGVLLCLNRGLPLNRCQSFIDLSLSETKERVRAILVAAMDDWSHPSEELITAWKGRTSVSP